MKTWPCAEVNGFICIWFHNGGKSLLVFIVLLIEKQACFLGNDPEWFLEPMEELTSGNYVLSGRSATTVNCDVLVREIWANGRIIVTIFSIFSDDCGEPF